MARLRVCIGNAGTGEGIIDGGDSSLGAIRASGPLSGSVDFLSGGGEMGALMRAHDWSASPLGDPQTWPQSLRAVVTLMINSRYPMFIAWGPKLAFLYNDGYAPIFGAKHPHMLGLPFRDAWPEIWEDISPLIDSALAGEATYNEDMHLVMERNGFPEDTWYSFSYSPVRDESGNVAGMFCACTETTEEVLARRRQAFLVKLGDTLRTLTDPVQIEKEACHLLGEFLAVDRAHYVEFREADDAALIRREFVRDGIATIVGEYALSDHGYVIPFYKAGQPVVVADVKASDLLNDAERSVTLANNVHAFIGVPCVKNGELVGAVAVACLQPRRWSEHEVQVVVETADRIWDAVERAKAEAALRESDARFRFFDRLSKATQNEADPEAIMTISTRLLGEHLGVDICPYADVEEDGDTFHIRKDWTSSGTPTIVGSYSLDDFGPVAAAAQRSGAPLVIRNAIADLGEEEASAFTSIGIAATICLPLVKHGRLAAMMAVHSATPRNWTEEDVSLVAEVAERCWAHVERVGAEAILRESEARLRALTDHLPGGMVYQIATGTDGKTRKFLFVSKSHEGLTGVPAEALLADPGVAYNLILHEDRAKLDEAEERALASGQPMDVQLRFVRTDGEVRWCRVISAPRKQPDGSLIWDGIQIDITDQKRALLALQESEERFRRIADSAPVPMWVSQLDRTRSFVNEAYLAFLRLPYDEAVRFDWRSIIHDDDRERVVAESVAGEASLRPFVLEGRYRRGDGEWRWLRSESQPRWGAEGEHIGFIGVAHDITDAKEAEATLRESERRFREQFENANDFIFTTDLKMQITSCNPAVASALERTPEELIGRSISEFTPPETWAHNKAMLTDKLAGKGDATRYEVEVFDQRGERMMWEINSRLIRDAEGAPTGLHAIGRDVTERRRNEEALAAQNNRLDLLARIAGELTLDKSPAERLEIVFNDIAQQIGAEYYFNYLVDEEYPDRLHLSASLGLTEDQRSAFADIGFGEYLCGKVAATRNAIVLDHLDKSEDLSCSGIKALGGKSYAGFPLIADGRLIGTIAFSSKSRAAFSEEEVAVIRTVADQIATALDRSRVMSELAAARETAEAEAAEQAAILGQLAEGVIITDADGRITFVNEAATRLHGVAALDVAPSEYSETYHLFREDGSPHPFEELPLARAVAGGETVTDARWRIRRPDGTDVLAIGNAQPVLGPAGKAVGAVLTVRDDTARHAAELALRESEERFRGLADNISQFAWIADPSGYIHWYNRRWYDYTGTTLEEMQGWGWTKVHHPDHADRVVASFSDKVIAGEAWEDIFPLRSAEGEYRWFLSRARPIRNDSGEIVRYFGTNTDIQDQRAAEEAVRELNETLEDRVLRRTAELEQAQEALRQSQKLEAMGQLTGGVAHDFNNLLTPILGSLDLLHRRGTGDEREQRLIDGALQSAERAKVLVQRLLAFARRQPLKTVAVDIRELIADMAELVGSTCGPGIKVTLSIPDDVPAALADQNQLEMAILNLSVNARDAMPDGGRLTLAATSAVVDKDDGGSLPPGRYVRVSVADTGTGMDEATVKRAIEPFFSTKGIGKGTGLGLSMVHGLASQLGGALTISSAPGLGTNIELWLPASDDLAETGAQAEQDASSATKAGTVLLVDDEMLVRASTADMLTELGYDVVEAASAEEALQLFGSGSAFDMLVTDHLMPGMNGVDLAHAVREHQPGIPVLIVSGYAETDGVPQYLPRLTKPFRQADLAGAIANLMETTVSVRSAE